MQNYHSSHKKLITAVFIGIIVMSIYKCKVTENKYNKAQKALADFLHCPKLRGPKKNILCLALKKNIKTSLCHQGH